MSQEIRRDGSLNEHISRARSPLNKPCVGLCGPPFLRRLKRLGGTQMGCFRNFKSPLSATPQAPPRPYAPSFFKRNLSKANACPNPRCSPPSPRPPLYPLPPSFPSPTPTPSSPKPLLPCSPHPSPDAFKPPPCPPPLRPQKKSVKGSCMPKTPLPRKLSMTGTRAVCNGTGEICNLLARKPRGFHSAWIWENCSGSAALAAAIKSGRGPQRTEQMRTF